MIHTYPKMNEIVKDLLRRSEEPMDQYILARIEELEKNQATPRNCYTCDWSGDGEEIDDYGHCWKHNGEPDFKQDMNHGCEEWKPKEAAASGRGS